MGDNNTTGANITPTERIVLFQNYMDWEGAAGINYRHKIEEKERKEKTVKGSTTGFPKTNVAFFGNQCRSKKGNRCIFCIIKFLVFATSVLGKCWKSCTPLN